MPHLRPRTPCTQAALEEISFRASNAVLELRLSRWDLALRVELCARSAPGSGWLFCPFLAAVADDLATTQPWLLAGCNAMLITSIYTPLLCHSTLIISRIMFLCDPLRP